MDLSKTISDLYEEKARLEKVIASLEQLGEASTMVSVVTPRRGRKFMSPQERRQVSERMRKYWENRKAAEHTDAAKVLTAASAA